jgi:hypothetical protein
VTELQQFMAGCRERGKMTLSDHLTLAGFTIDYNKRKSMEAAAVRAIMEDQRYQELRGTVICPSPNTRAAWAKDIKPMEDECPKVSFSTSLILGNAMNPILEKNDWRFEATEPAIRNAMATVATASNRKQDLVATGFVRQNDELDYVKERLRRCEADLLRERDDNAYLKAQNESLLGAVLAQSKTEVAPSTRRGNGSESRESR